MQGPESIDVTIAGKAGSGRTPIGQCVNAGTLSHRMRSDVRSHGVKSVSKKHCGKPSQPSKGSILELEKGRATTEESEGYPLRFSAESPPFSLFELYSEYSYVIEFKGVKSQALSLFSVSRRCLRPNRGIMYTSLASNARGSLLCIARVQNDKFELSTVDRQTLCEQSFAIS
jgi:hypothetical protein